MIKASADEQIKAMVAARWRKQMPRKERRMDQRTHEAKRNNGGTTWLTCDEVAFVQRLGTHTEHGVKTPTLVHLQRYLEGAKLRQEWGKIDKTAVVKEATRLLRAEQRKANRETAA